MRALLPPEDRYNMPLPRVLISVAELMRTPEDIQQTAGSVLSGSSVQRPRLSQANCSRKIPGLGYRGIIGTTIQQRWFRRRAEVSASDDAGISAAHFLSHGQSTALDIVRHTCRKMAEAASTISLAALSSLSTDARGSCHTSRKCCTTMPALAALPSLLQVTGNDKRVLLPKESWIT